MHAGKASARPARATFAVAKSPWVRSISEQIAAVQKVAIQAIQAIKGIGGIIGDNIEGVSVGADAAGAAALNVKSPPACWVPRPSNCAARSANSLEKYALPDRGFGGRGGFPVEFGLFPTVVPPLR
jgi:hypothetical protein